MPERRSSVLEGPRFGRSLDEPTTGAGLVRLVDRPLAGRIPRHRPVPGPTPRTVDSNSAAGRVPASGSGGSGSFFRACILLLLQEHPAHGYDVLERLSPFGFDSGDSGWLYRTLRAYEREAILESTWQISSSGPPRRVYSLTAEGAAVLDEWATALRGSKRGIDDFLDRHSRAVHDRPGS
ncbi:MAG: helix-turn-helix transcriptional regulator [Chloroflexi bacterium]|nr:helix-turn-helix transcriptional regulator [Chloroflexota bacterium]